MELSSKNDELKIQLLSLKSHEGFKYLLDNVGHWRNQCLNEILESEDSIKSKGEYKAYGRVINAVDFFLQQLEGNPGHGPNLDPHQ